MVKVITYGTYDLLHYGHIRLLERAKALGDYLIVGVTAEDFDKARGKINVQQSLMERIEAIKNTGLADEVIVEEYEGQKIDDIQRYDVDIFAIGSDWSGKFDYLKEYCDVVYLDRTEGVSSTGLRSERNLVRLGLVGSVGGIRKYIAEASFVNGLVVEGVLVNDKEQFTKEFPNIMFMADTFEELLEKVDAVYIISHPLQHYSQIRCALLKGKHVLCESPIALNVDQYKELVALAQEKGLVLMDAIKTAYSMAYNRLILLLKGGKIGRIVSVDAVCTSLQDLQSSDYKDLDKKWNSICAWGPTALLPIFQLLGPDYKSRVITSNFIDREKSFDVFSKISFIYDHAVASVKVGKGVKSEGELIISGTQGYVYVPAPWWKMDYFEIRYEDSNRNRRYFYQLDGEGIRYELVSFLKAVESNRNSHYIQPSTSLAIVRIIEDFYNDDVVCI
ncbi:MAG: adenylyltransferase/cytidyltransferase family protein [Prevotella sp.]|nr:adenylyltransferase/cytidyltransferase family protein [Prevotella sp.]